MARDFDGSNDIVSRGSVISTVTDNYTMACWFRSTTADTGHIFGNGARSGGGGTGYRMRWSTSGANKVLQHDLNFVAAATGTTALVTDTWYQGVIVRRSGTAYVYLNGTQEGSTTTSTPNTPSAHASIGLAADGGGNNDGLDCVVAECAMWERALSDGEIAALAKGYSPLFFPNDLVAYLPLIGNNSPEIDLVNAQTWAVTEATKFPHPRIIYPVAGL